LYAGERLPATLLTGGTTLIIKPDVGRTATTRDCLHRRKTVSYGRDHAGVLVSKSVDIGIISYSLALDLPLLRKLNYVLFSSTYSLTRGFLCRKQTWTVTVIHYWTDGRQLIAVIDR